MPSFLDWINPFSKKNPLQNSIKNFSFGTPETRENVSTLRPEQEPLFEQAVNAGLKPGAGGAFGTSADYYRNLMSDDSADFNAFAAPQLRQYNQDIVPWISEQFAGMGSGGLSSSGFQNAQTQGATDLAERLGQIRANLRHSGAQGLTNIGQIGLQPYSQNMVTQPGSEGFISSFAPTIGTAVGTAIGGPGGGVAGNAAGNWFKNSFGGNKVGVNSSPYGTNSLNASPQIKTPGGGFNLPNFLQR